MWTNINTYTEILRLNEKQIKYIRIAEYVMYTLAIFTYISRK